MQLLTPKIIPGSTWTAYGSTDAASVWTQAFIAPRAPTPYIYMIGLPTEGQTLIIGAFTYTFRATPVGQREVKIEATAALTVTNLVNEINFVDYTTFKARAFSSAVDAVYTGEKFYVEGLTTGSAASIAVGGTGPFTVIDLWTTGTLNVFAAIGGVVTIFGNDGALEYEGTSFVLNVTVAGASDMGYPIALSGLVNASTSATIGTQIVAQVHAVTPGIIGSITIPNPPTNGGRTKISTLAVGIGNRLEIIDIPGPYVPTRLETALNDKVSPLWEVGQFAEGKTTGHPSNDTADTIWPNTNYIRLQHPAEPVFFRNENRPLIDLAENDKRIADELFALRDGYIQSTGVELGSGDNRLTFKAKSGYIFNSPVRFNSDVYVTGTYTIINTSNLSIDDNLITLNNGEVGTAVTEGKAGLNIDRGVNDVTLLWQESATPVPSSAAILTAIRAGVGGYNGGFWEFDGPVIGTTDGGKSLFIGKSDGAGTAYGTVIEVEQITIGDGINTFGTFNSNTVSFNDALEKAIARLVSGGKIFIKRGTYIVTGAAITCAQANIKIEGEGKATQITCTDAGIIFTAASVNTIIKDIYFNVPTTKTGLTFNAACEQMSVTNCNFTATGTGVGISFVATSKQGILIGSRFTGTGIDVTHTVADNHMFVGNLSDTSTTNI
jgi:hypothetical protein